MPVEPLPPGKEGAVVAVKEVALHGVGLALEGDISRGIPLHGQPDQPLDNINQIKENKQHLTLLGSVDALMIHHLVTQIHPMMHKQNSQQIDG